MKLMAQLLEQVTDPTISISERARLRCFISKMLEEAGDYEKACAAMGDLWSPSDERPQLNKLDQSTRAEVLLRVGSLTGWIGNVKQIEGAQETAKNLISESISLFKSLQDNGKIAEAQTEIAKCYLREGLLDEARILLNDILNRFNN